jgi:hypothetical protein
MNSRKKTQSGGRIKKEVEEQDGVSTAFKPAPAKRKRVDIELSDDDDELDNEYIISPSRKLRLVKKAAMKKPQAASSKVRHLAFISSTKHFLIKPGPGYHSRTLRGI